MTIPDNTRSDILRRFSKLKVWKRGDQRAPHKPLLVLLSLGRIMAGCERFARFADIEKKLSKLLRDFGPHRSSYHPEFPFWHMQTDGIWEIPRVEQLGQAKGLSRVCRGLFLQNDVSGGFPSDVYDALKNDPKLVRDIAKAILAAHFPESYHDDLILETGLDCLFGTDSDIDIAADIHTAAIIQQKRSAEFRHRILRAYEYRCCVCDLGLQLGLAPIGVEAAHIKWHQAGGPAEEPNGLCLCALHHKLFDRGAWGLTESLQIVVSEETSGPGKEEWLLRFLGRKIRIPTRVDYKPGDVFRQWHVKEVLQHPFLAL